MTKKRAQRIALYAGLTCLALLFLVPVYVLLVTSFKGLDEITLERMWALPKSLDWSGYREAVSKLYPHLSNSFLLAVPATLLSALFGSMNGYVLSKWQFKGSNALFALMLFGMFIPYQSILIPLIQFMQRIHLYNSIPGLILIHVVYGLPVCTLMFRNFYVAIPNEMLEAAKIDGCGFFGIYKNMMVPLSVTGFVVVGIWQFTNIWNEFLFAVTMTTQKQQPIMVALQNLSGSQIVQWNVQMAGALLAALPTLLVYIFLGRYFIRGLLAGSIKG
ncbi:carbohydrate ABC transporter permease [Paenibacillus melissococcoides]|uniref:Carbohydrate ABC transporter permease n=1 Tax=Paenibacillus melissococcoides TaxID=2912268 RepID=A0ABM9G8Q6_9BACL|nr:MULTISPECIES: carbohydrate ABC transporter permease [Paenibacillus]MEB9892706.1 carbohydrate ABC transporter permease [Bacillus cereus]CAH8248363.1 carbohydrate ABC transporter permease [Paenibacillus melissococcoides]CAH8717709.1 carbohydrate ABC transporter permease [Paenibacillus melissococcoides]CAH8719412.1 carbohydrate ABC transporter permease [Paenibacillus melissococcoides]GIO77166.1 sugar ABC transporter permease [Paenibacillus dendritiformis]